MPLVMSDYEALGTNLLLSAASGCGTTERKPLRATLQSLRTGVSSHNFSFFMPEWKLAKNSFMNTHLCHNKQKLYQSSIIMSPFFSMQGFAFSL